MRYIRIYAKFFQRVFTHRAQSTFWLVMAFMNPLIMIALWKGAISGAETIDGYTLSNIQSYFLTLVSLSLLNSNGIDENIAYRDIQMGDLTNHLTRPFSYVLIHTFRETPFQIWQVSFGLLAIVFISNVWDITIFNISFEQFMWFIPILILSFLVMVFTRMLTGLLAFWVTDYRGFSSMITIMGIFLGGFTLPIDMFDQPYRMIAHLTPFPYIYYYPAHFLTERASVSQAPQVIIAQLIALIILVGLYRIVWSSGIKKFAAVGQ